MSLSVPSMSAADRDYNFAYDFFSANISIWSNLIEKYRPTRILEIGSFEGRSATFILEKCSMYAAVEVHCIDPWHDSPEFASINIDASAIETKFDRNIAIAQTRCTNPAKVHKHKGFSIDQLPKILLEKGKNYFDFVYIDGSHTSADVLTDAVFSFYLLKIGGIMIFDDYLWGVWGDQRDLVNTPKLGVDSFMNTFRSKMTIIGEYTLYQLYTQKASD